MQKEDCFYFGKVIKTHGIKGEISIRIDADDPSKYKGIEFILMDIHKSLIPFFIQKMSLHSNKANLKLQDVETIEKAMEFTGHELFLPLEMLPKLTGNKFYYHEVPGFKIVDENFGLVGIIDQVLEYPTQALFQVMVDNIEVLIPIQDEVITKVDRRSKTIYIQAPHGLIEMYLNSWTHERWTTFSF